ncbi:MAG: hypothetical protein N4J56_004519 [Chroococcidiopsis sp. SAG 2025]|uniref:DNA polymerase III subunit gamma/tau n=1 Tax=Chroococcidiopsis sp. SAG 2025 TaxID=171389 RepID=UPI00293744D4|nr:DNA polymerase III subunit gamma/tau [Chroococcidiopsis sp. SAG 2025]MDV2994865.1 hypothetical protein [Chroococcidiopsis sp. SAG 2025]
MVYQPLHHKYRPQTFAQLVGQQAVATTLTNAVNSGRIAPAYLFTGPRGTGKTSSARILAKSLNCQNSDSPMPSPCGQCNSCKAIASSSALDVVEIDAASNSSVENIRETIERCQLAPIECRYKVYCIDECHSLSNQAFQALLKTLEEPPFRVVFVLCTTEVHKVPATIASRCLRFDFKRVGIEAMVQHLSAIAARESIDITPAAIGLVAQLSSGCLRDAQCLLDQLSLLSTTITPNWVWEVAGAVPEHELLTLLEAIARNDDNTVLRVLRDLLEYGKEPLAILQSLASFYRDLLIAKTAPDRGDMVGLTADTWQELCKIAQTWEKSAILQAQQHLKASEVQVKLSSQPQLWLEIIVLGLLPNAKKSANTDSTVVTPVVNAPPWINWKTPTDALAWGQQQLPHLGLEELQKQWNTLQPINGKKATAWVTLVENQKVSH